MEEKESFEKLFGAKQIDFPKIGEKNCNISIWCIRISQNLELFFFSIKPNDAIAQRTANANAAGLRRICKRSDQPKNIERLENNDARLILRRKLNGATT